MNPKPAHIATWKALRLALAALSRAHAASPTRNKQHPDRRSHARRARAIHAAQAMLQSTPHRRALGYALWSLDAEALALDMAAALRAAFIHAPPHHTLTEERVARALGEGIDTACARWCASPDGFRLVTAPADVGRHDQQGHTP